MRKDVISTLLELKASIKGNKSHKISLKEMMDSMTDPEMGIFLVVTTLSLIVILPIGAIPGIPAFSGIALCILFLTILLSHDEESSNPIMSFVRFKKKNLLNYAQQLSSYLEKIEHWSKANRLEVLNSQMSLKISCIIGILLSIIMIVIGFIPFLPTVLMVPVILFSLGFIFNDGLFTALGYVSSFIVMTALLIMVLL